MIGSGEDAVGARNPGLDWPSFLLDAIGVELHSHDVRPPNGVVTVEVATVTPGCGHLRRPYPWLTYVTSNEVGGCS